MPNAISLIPELTNQDIDWVQDLMQLKPFDGPRRAFLTGNSTLDVSACPGSGKTTLIIAKLAILARKWPHKTKGICVLSHTNVAREEIQRHLGNTVVGQRLLGYPHFIDTIHGFVNRFLALPWLNSNGFPPPTIDDDVTTAYRRGLLADAEYWTLQAFLAKKFCNFDQLRICGRDCSFDLGGKTFPAGPNTKSFKIAKQVIEKAAQAGYFCYDEMFVWAWALLEDFPEIASWLRRRFPVVIIDEMQDTSEAQSAMLDAVFPRTSPDIVMWRLGDPNQAIFDHIDAKPNKSDPFPDEEPLRNLTIPNSYRFGPEVAALASPFAVKPVCATGICGIGPRMIIGAPTSCKHAIFIFPDGTTAGLLDAYGKHVLEHFGDDVLTKGLVTAVGAVHREASDVTPGDPQYPKSVSHYWSGYTADIARKEPHPSSLVQYIRAAQMIVRDCRDFSPGVEKLCFGLIRLASLIGNAGHIRRKGRKHRTIVELLEADDRVLEVYRQLIKKLLIDWTPLIKDNWDELQADILTIACALCDGETSRINATNFLELPEDKPIIVESTKSPTDAGPNIYRVLDGDRYVDIRLGSIHSVKGQTHLATLLLNTYWHAHSSHRILPWLLGNKIYENGAGVQDRQRLLQTYVAMTRPSHMICLAVPRSILGNAEAFIQHIATLSIRGWQTAEIIEGSIVWHEIHTRT